MLDADTIVARRRYKRSASLWRIAAIVSIVIAVVVAILAGSGLALYSDHIARIRIDGLIRGDAQTLKLLSELEEANRVKAVIVHIDSPGGTTAGSEAIYESLRKISARKPVVSVMGTVAASGGYITAIATDHIVARGNTITGSIGVIFQWAEVNRLLDTLGIKMQEIKSSELKAEPNMFNPLTEKVREVTKAMIDDSYAWFVGLVAERRDLSQAEATRLGDGRVYTGRQALEVRLVDAIGGEETALAWLRTERDIPASLQVIDWKADAFEETGLFSLQGLAKAFGLDHVYNAAKKTLQGEGHRLDGLMSVWHPAQR